MRSSSSVTRGVSIAQFGHSATLSASYVWHASVNMQCACPSSVVPMARVTIRQARQIPYAAVRTNPQKDSDESENSLFVPTADSRPKHEGQAASAKRTGPGTLRLTEGSRRQ